MPDRSLTLEQLMQQRHPEIQLFAMFMKPTERMLKDRANPEFREVLREAFLYLWDLEEQGKLLLSGPLDEGTPDQEGMALLAVASREQAEAIAAEEPLAKAGWRSNRIRRFQLNEGVAVPTARELVEKAGQS